MLKWKEVKDDFGNCFTQGLVNCETALKDKEFENKVKALYYARNAIYWGMSKYIRENYEKLIQENIEIPFSELSEKNGEETLNKVYSS